VSARRQPASTLLPGLPVCIKKYCLLIATHRATPPWVVVWISFPWKPVSLIGKNPANGAWDLLPGNSDLTSAEIELLELPQREQRMAKVLHVVRNAYDYILIDCPPSLNILTLNAFVAADSVLVPIQCEYYALEGLSALLQTVDDVREAVNQNLHIEGCRL